MNSGLQGTLTENWAGPRGSVLCDPLSEFPRGSTVATWSLVCPSSVQQRSPSPREHPCSEGPPPGGPGCEHQGGPSAATPGQRGHQKAFSSVTCHLTSTLSWIHVLPSPAPHQVPRSSGHSSVSGLLHSRPSLRLYHLTDASPRWAASLRRLEARLIPSSLLNPT